jgi:myo-inositol 2-dehydrogenase/D-chiro-inositol 1-dehydrogenase
MTYMIRDTASFEPVRLGLIGSGWMGAFHAESAASRIPGVTLEAIADPATSPALELADRLGIGKVTGDAADLFADPQIDGVIIAAPARFHAALIAAAARAGKHIFCEKPAARTLEELSGALAAVETAHVEFQVGFNRRFAADFATAKQDVEAGRIGEPRLLRSVTRDPGVVTGIANAERIPQWTIFLETLIHDFDTLNWFNEGAHPVEVHAVADALVEPNLKDQGFLDTAVVTIRYSNGAIAVAEANFSALYGYDVRGEVFGSTGMVTAGTVQENSALAFTADGINARTSRLNIELFHDAYVAEIAHFAAAIGSRRDGQTPPQVKAPGGADAYCALALALACIESVETGAPVHLTDSEPKTAGA